MTLTEPNEIHVRPPTTKQPTLASCEDRQFAQGPDNPNTGL